MTDPNVPETDVERNWRELREKAERQEALIAELEAEKQALGQENKSFKVEHAFKEAGFDMADGRVAGAILQYGDGDLSPEKVKEWGLSNGWLVDQPDPPSQEATAAGQITNAHVGGTPPPVTGDKDAYVAELAAIPANTPSDEALRMIAAIAERHGSPVSYST